MRTRHLSWTLLLLLFLPAAACLIDEAGVLDGKPCAPDGSCAPGYACVREACGEGYLCSVCRGGAVAPDGGDGQDGGDGDAGDGGDGPPTCDQAPPTCLTLPDCQATSPSCTGGVWLCATGYEPLERTCDGLDNDCDGRTDAGLVCRLAGGGGAGLQDGLGDAARFDAPRGLAVAPTGGVVVADRGNHALRHVTPEGEVTTLAGDGQFGYLDGAAAEARFREPTALAFAPDGSLIVADSLNHRIRRLTVAGVVETLAGSGFPDHRDGPAAQAQFALPSGVAVAADGTVIVADTGNHCLRRISGGEVSTFSGRCEAPGMADGAAADARFNGPTDLVFLADGRLVVSEESNHALRLVDPDGAVTTLAGEGVAGFHDGAPLEARFWKPAGLARAADGGLVLVADPGNHRVRRVDATEVTTAVGSGGLGLDDGPPALATFRYPGGLAALPDGQLVIADTQNHALRVTRP